MATVVFAWNKINICVTFAYHMRNLSWDTRQAHDTGVEILDKIFFQEKFFGAGKVVPGDYQEDFQRNKKTRVDTTRSRIVKHYKLQPGKSTTFFLLSAYAHIPGRAMGGVPGST